MKSFIKSLNNKQEFFLIIVIAFGYAVYVSNSDLYYHVITRAQTTWVSHSSTRGAITVSLQCFTILLFGWYILKNRGYKLGDFNLQFSWNQIGYAFLLYYIIGIIVHSIRFILFEFDPFFYHVATTQVSSEQNQNLISIILILLLDPLQEEFFLNGYLFKRLEQYLRPSAIILISLTIRLSYHTYQGWTCLLFTLPFGLVVTLYYSKYKKLWPVILAHILNNSLAHFYHYTHK